MPVRFPGTSSSPQQNFINPSVSNGYGQNSYYVDPYANRSQGKPSCFGDYNFANQNCLTCSMRRECIIEQELQKKEVEAAQEAQKKSTQETQNTRRESVKGVTVKSHKRRRYNSNNDFNRIILHALISGFVAFLSDFGLQLVKDIQYKLEK